MRPSLKITKKVHGCFSLVLSIFSFIIFFIDSTNIQGLYPCGVYALVGERKISYGITMIVRILTWSPKFQPSFEDALYNSFPFAHGQDLGMMEHYAIDQVSEERSV